MKKHFSQPITNILLSMLSLALLVFVSACSDDDEPVREDTPELITKVILTFTPEGGGTDVVATATDPDGVGLQNLTTDGPIELNASTMYVLTIELLNELASPGSAAYNITEEVEEEGDEHMLFFSWTNNVFSDPAGNGNIDNRADALNYDDEDVNSLPIGLTTSWTTSTPASGTFRVVLKHQPGLKSATSTVNDGETDLDIDFDINIQ